MKDGEMIYIFGRWHVWSFAICLVLVCIFGSFSPYSTWIVLASVLGGAVITYFLVRADKKREAALQSKNDVVE